MVGQGDGGSDVQNRGQKYSRNNQLPFQSLFDFFILVHHHEISGEETGDKTDTNSQSADNQRIEHSPIIQSGGTLRQNNQGGTGTFRETSEKISAHSGDIADIISHIVRNGSRVFGGVFGQVVFELTD